MGKGEGASDRPALSLDGADLANGSRELKLSLVDGTPVTFRLLFAGESAGARASYAKAGDPEIVVYGYRKDGTLSTRPIVGLHASVLLQGGQRLRSEALCLRSYDERLDGEQRAQLTDWIRERMERDPDPARWHWVRVTLAAEELSTREHREIPWDEIIEIDKRIAAENDAMPRGRSRRRGISRAAIHEARHGIRCECGEIAGHAPTCPMRHLPGA